MQPHLWARVRTLFDELVELSPEDAAARLHLLGDRDPELVAAVASLLEADRAADGKLQAIETALLPASESASDGSLPDPFGLTGRQLGHFRIIDVLAADGMGVVYRATDTTLDRTVAVKVPRPEYRPGDQIKQRFLREARTIAGLDHPNLCSIHEVGESEDGLPFLAMPLYPGETLKARLAREGPLPVTEVVAIAAQLIAGLIAVHEAGVIHRDVKPGNIIVLPDGGVKILDFGLAKSDDITITRSGGQLGTVAYMSPEQIRSEAVDARTDLWSVGVVLYELLTGTRPFDGESGVAIAHRIVHQAPMRPAALRHDIPAALESLIHSLLRKDPDRRVQTARQVAEELAAIGTGRDTAAASQFRQLWTVATGWRQQRPVARALVVALVLVASIGGWWLLSGSRDGSVAPLPPRGSLAVLPFANLSGDPQQEYFSDGLTEELMTRLARIPGLRVTARATSFQFKSGEPDIRELGRVLGVAAVLTGSVQKSDQRIRVTVRLIDAVSGYHLWSENFERNVEEVFDLQDEIGAGVAAAFSLRFPPTDLPRPPATRNAEAHDLYLKGRHFWNQRTEAALVRATEYFNRAIALDSGYADAYSGLADVDIAPRGGRPAERFARAKVAAARALELDSTLADAHFSMGWINMWYDRDWAAAERHLLRGMLLNPSHVWGLGWYAAYLAATGRAEASLAFIQRSARLDPLSYPHSSYVGAHYLWLDRPGDAIPYFLQTLDLAPDFFMAHWGLGLAYLRQGRASDALPEFEPTGGDFVGLHRDGLLGYAHALAGHQAEARRILEAIDSQRRSGEYISPLDPALVHLGLGEREAALDWLERLVDDRGARFFLVDPIFNPVRADPRFERLVATLIPTTRAPH